MCFGVALLIATIASIIAMRKAHQAFVEFGEYVIPIVRTKSQVSSLSTSIMGGIDELEQSSSLQTATEAHQKIEKYIESLLVVLSDESAVKGLGSFEELNILRKYSNDFFSEKLSLIETEAAIKQKKIFTVTKLNHILEELELADFQGASSGVDRLVLEIASLLVNLDYFVDLKSEEGLLKYQYKLREFSSTLSKLKEASLRSEIAKDLFEISDLSEGGAAWSELFKKQAELSEQLGSKRDLIFAETDLVLRKISKLSSDLRKYSAEYISDSRERSFGLLFAFSVVLPLLLLGSLLVFIRTLDRKVTIRLNSLTTSMKKLSAGNLDVEIEDSLDDELGAAFQALEVFRNNSKQVVRQKDLIAGIMDSTPSLLGLFDSSGSCKLVNKALISWFAKEGKLFLGESLRDVFGHEVSSNIKNSSDILRFEAQLDKPGERPRWFAFVLVPVGDFGEILVHASDIDEIKLLQLELERSNDDLSQFAYIVAHDLRSPLRAIYNYSNWIIEDAGELVPTETKEHIHKLQQRVDGMQRLLNDILDYSRIKKEKKAAEKLEVNNLVQEIIDLIDLPEGFSVSIDKDLPTVNTERAALSLVFQNLIENGIKHHDKSTGTIEVSGEVSGRFAEFSVSDDGPGIDPSFQVKVFEMFRSLSANKASSGMGLSFVKKMVETHGGRIWVDSEGGNGSAFKFIWPLEPF